LLDRHALRRQANQCRNSTTSPVSLPSCALGRRLDLKLLNRTTRGVAPTEAGERLFQTVGPRFEDIEAELAVLGEMRGLPASPAVALVVEAWRLAVPA